ncbi:MAG TPA: hypothetical protein VHW25_18620 [Steroidobacteraceae bacterium]|jgi:hypothetical protein|nr:hypothetical protein [Steroidobacteraceae bacterium]
MRTPIIFAATAITLAVVGLCACTAGRLTAADSPRDAPQVAPAAPFGPVSAVTVTFSDEAQQLAVTDARLTPDAVAVAVEHELQVHQLYAPASASVHRSLAITVENFTNELASNTRILGFTYRNVMLNAMVQVQGAAAAAQPPFDVHARVRITSRATAAEGSSLAQLYTRFAVVTVAALRGVEPPSP